MPGGSHLLKMLPTSIAQARQVNILTTQSLHIFATMDLSPGSPAQ